MLLCESLLAAIYAPIEQLKKAGLRIRTKFQTPSGRSKRRARHSCVRRGLRSCAAAVPAPGATLDVMESAALYFMRSCAEYRADKNKFRRSPLSAAPQENLIRPWNLKEHTVCSPDHLRGAAAPFASLVIHTRNSYTSRQCITAASEIRTRHSGAGIGADWHSRC